MNLRIKKCIRCGRRYERWRTSFIDRYTEASVTTYTPLIGKGYCRECFEIMNAELDAALLGTTDAPGNFGDLKYEGMKAPGKILARLQLPIVHFRIDHNVERILRMDPGDARVKRIAWKLRTLRQKEVALYLALGRWCPEGMSHFQEKMDEEAPFVLVAYGSRRRSP